VRRLATFVLAVVMVAVVAAPSRADVHRRKVATALSAGGAAASATVMGLSLLVGTPGTVNQTMLDIGFATAIVTPSLGEYYAHQYLTIGEGIRAGGALVAILGVNQTETVSCNNGSPGPCTSITGTGVVMLGLAGIAFVGGAFYDILDAGNAVDRYDVRVSVVPMLTPGGGGGLALTGRW
jgi:hypothetical protein